MKNQASRKQNRGWIIINYLSLIAGVLLFYPVKNHYWPLSFLFFEIGICGMFLISHYKAFIVTGHWKMVHASSKNLDEREMHVVLNALKYAYSIFAIMCLIIIYAYAVAEYQAIDVLIAAGLLYLAHTLPAAIVGWNENKSVIDD